jgi:hypothetical protein
VSCGWGVPREGVVRRGKPVSEEHRTSVWKRKPRVCWMQTLGASRRKDNTLVLVGLQAGKTDMGADTRHRHARYNAGPMGAKRGTDRLL